ncbi:YhdP family protein [Thioalkalivibrio sp. ALJ2]|uniref:YhdP family protein n=1 Tax=Thioalkalivibrio sp. ALJ2 TaxID=1261622 RepID=UPI00036FF10B|nr:YhdP family protein [Thioalkalivibrio sp. ALJ2]
MRALSHSVRVAVGVLLLLIALAALALLSLRLTVAHWDGLGEWVETTASAQLGYPVRTDEIELGWSGWSPALVARGVSVDLSGEEPLHLERLRLSLSAGATLRSRFPSMQIEVAGTEVRVVREADGAIHVHGYEVGLGDGALLEIPVERWPDLEASEVRITWEDRGAALESVLDVRRLAVRTDARGRLRVFLDGAMQGAADGDFILGVEVPDATARDARFFLDTQPVALGAWSPWLVRLGWEPPPGTTALRLWGEIDDGRVVALRGEHDTQLDGAGGEPGGAFGHRFDWRVRGAAHESNWTATRPGSGDLRLRYTLGGEPEALIVEALELAARDLEVEPYAPLLFLVEQRAPELAAPLREVRPRGRLGDAWVRARHDGERLEPAEGLAQLRDLQWHAGDYGPGVQGVDGEVSWREGGLELDLDSRNVRFEMPTLFDDPLWVETVRGRLRAERSEAGDWRIAGEGLDVANEHAAARGRMRLLFDGHESGPRVDLALDILRADGDYTQRYLPIHLLPSNTYQWLAESIQTGVSDGGGMVYRGRGRDFPFTDQSGVFDLWADIEEGRLDYEPGWPVAEDLRGRLLFHNASFRATDVSGRILDTAVHGTEVWIDDMMDTPVLEIEGTGDGTAQDLLLYLRQAGLLEDAAEIRDAAMIEGPTRLALGITLPLDEDRLQDVRVQGRLDLLHTRAEVAGWPTGFEAVEGAVHFDTHDRVWADDVQARVHGEWINVSADWPLNGEEATIRAHGPQPLEPWLEEIPALQPYLEGRATWDATLRLGDAIDGVRLDLSSDLVGVGIDWPSPIGKEPDERRPLEVTLPFGHSRAGIGHVRLGETLRAHLRLSPSQAPDDPAARGVDPQTAAAGTDVQAMALEIGIPAATLLSLPGEGLSVRARLPKLEVQPWLEALAEAPWARDVDLGDVEAADGSGGLSLQRIELDVRDRIRWGELEIPGMRLQGQRRDEGWDLEAQSAWLAGSASWRASGDGRDRWQARLRHLILEDVEFDGEPDSDTTVRAVEGGGLEDPREWPGVDLILDRLQVGEYRLADVHLALEPVDQGLRVESLRARGPDGDLRAQGTGHWHVLADGRPDSRLDVRLSGDDWGGALSSARLSRALVGGEGEGRLDLSWPGPLYAPRLALLAGTMELELEDGRLADVEPGAGRLLGLVSLDVLPRRLRLDFRDVFTEGLSFDRLEATATLQDGNLHVPDLEMRGPSARVRLSGRTGLVARDYDHHIVVVPSLRTALPIVGALVGGPVTGVVVLLAERVLGIGDQIEEAARVEYRVTGPWDDPEVQTLVQPATDNDD